MLSLAFRLSLSFFLVLPVCSSLSIQAQDEVGGELLQQGLDPRSSVEPQFRKRDLKRPKKGDFFAGGEKIFPKNFQAPIRDPKAIEIDSRVQADSDYPVGPGDQFLINFWGKIDDNLITSIDSEYKLFIPRLGFIDATDKTYRELQEAIEMKVKAELRNVEFTVSLYRPRSFPVYVLGSVSKPGIQNVSAKSRASDVIAMAGGPLATGSQQFIEIRRKDRKIPVNLLRFRNAGDFSANPYLTNNDVVFVPPLDRFVSISGAIVNPGTFEIRETKILQDVIQSMGGLSTHADPAAPIKVSRLTKSGSREIVLVSQAPEQGELAMQNSSAAFELAHGDEIFVSSSELLIPSQTNNVFITGAVRLVGARPYSPGAAADEYIGMAGGLTDRANFTSAVIYRADGSTVRLMPRTAIEPGDTIHIPEKTFKFWQDHLAIVTTFISLATSIIVLSGR